MLYKNLWEIELKWAVTFTAIALFWMFLEKLVGLHDQYIEYHVYLTNLFAIPAITIMVLALFDKRKSYYNGYITYKQGLISGTILSFIIALLSPLSQWITLNVITPEYFTNIIKYTVEMGYY